MKLSFTWPSCIILFFLSLADVAVSQTTLQGVKSSPLGITKIYEIQGQTADSPFKGQSGIKTTGIVTAALSDRYFLQDGVGAWSGLYVYAPGNAVAVGDSIVVTGTITEYYNLTQLYNITETVVISSGKKLPDPITITSGAVSAEQYESVLVKVQNAPCINIDSPVGSLEWLINDGSGPTVVDNMIYQHSPVINSRYTVTGPVYYTYSTSKVEPRNAADVSLETIPADSKNVTFSVDLTKLVTASKFNPEKDLVYIRGTLNNNELSDPLTLQAGNIYSTTIPVKQNSYTEYKFYITSSGAENSGWEWNTGASLSGNRVLNMGTNDIVLPTVFFSDGDMRLGKTTAHFKFYYSAQEDAIIDKFAQKIEDNYSRVTNALDIAIPQKIDIKIYRDVKILHNAMGYPEFPDWATGSAHGKTLITILSPVVFDYNASVEVLVHEFVHITNAWKTKGILPQWINEGVATYYARQEQAKSDIANKITSLGAKPTLDQLNNYVTFNDFGGYAMSYTIAYFIAKMKGPAALANFVETLDYTSLGYADKIDFQTAWHQFLDIYTNISKKVNVKFSVNMAEMISANKFNPATDKVYVRGSFNNWGTANQVLKESGTIYSVTLPVIQYYLYNYKFFVNTPGATNSGWEDNIGEALDGNRILDAEAAPVNLPVIYFNSNLVTDIQAVESQNISLRVVDGQLKMENLPVNHPVSVYSLSGQLLKRINPTCSEMSVQLPAGIYLVAIGRYCTKILIPL